MLNMSPCCLRDAPDGHNHPPSQPLHIATYFSLWQAFCSLYRQPLTLPRQFTTLQLQQSRLFIRDRWDWGVFPKLLPELGLLVSFGARETSDNS